MASEYDWHPTSNKGGSVFKVETRNLGWWVLLAVLVSIGVHVLLFYFLNQDFIRKARGEDFLEFRVQTKQESIDRSELEKLLAQEPDLSQEIIEPENLSEMDITRDIDEFELMDILKDEPIRMAPVDAPEIPEAALPKAPKEALDMAAQDLNLATAESLAQELDDMRSKLINESNRVATDQPIMEIDASDLKKGVNTDQFFKDAAAKVMGKEADEFVRGYASLDELIGRTGGIQKGSRMTAVMPSDILFEYNEATLKDEAEIAMMKLAYLIETNPDAVFVIEGHTDSFGGPDYNLSLSQKRAEAVREWLIRKLRIDPSNVRVEGKGKTQPIVPTTGTAEEQALNRRVEIEIRKP